MVAEDAGAGGGGGSGDEPSLWRGVMELFMNVSQVNDLSGKTHQAVKPG